jgi:hypothetical protein
MCRLNAGFTAGSEEALDALVPERLDYQRTVARSATNHKQVISLLSSPELIIA